MADFSIAASSEGPRAGQTEPAAASKQPVQQQQHKARGGDKHKGSKAGSAFRDFVSRQTPTNYNMLLFRTINRDLCQPNANEDYVAPLFRDQLMPVRGWVNRSFPRMLKVFKKGVEDLSYGVPGVCNFVDSRTKWLDGAVKAALEDGFTQVVCVAAGFDTRAYRFYRQGVTFFEVDLPWASQKKQALVKAALPSPKSLPRPVYVGADLSKVTLAEALAGTAFSPAKKTLFTMEGLIYYLPAEAVSKLVASVAGLAAPGSRLLFDFLRQDHLDGSTVTPGYQNCAEACSVKGEPFISALQPSPAAMDAYLRPLGFALHRVWSPREMLEKQLPHLKWDEDLPPIMACYAYAEAVKPEIPPTMMASVAREQAAKAD